LQQGFAQVAVMIWLWSSHNPRLVYLMYNAVLT
jgi:hypothetical protein